MPYSQAGNKATQKYRALNYKRISFELSKKYESEMIAFLESKPNVNAYIRELIKKDMMNRQ